MNTLESDALHAFAAFANRQSFTLAARELHISQPALHVKIQKLSQSLGETLYERHGRDLVLTRAGESLAAFARLQQRSAQAFLDELKGFKNRPLVLACGRGAFMNVIDAGIAAALKNGTKLRFLINNTPEAMDHVENGTADLAVGVFEAVPTKLEITPLAVYQQNLVVPRNHALAERKHIKIRDLDGMSLAVPPSRWPQRKSFDQELSAAGIQWDVAVEAPGWELLIHLAKLEVAPAITNSCVPILPGLVAIPIRGLPTVTYSALTRQSLNPSVASLIATLKKRAR